MRVWKHSPVRSIPEALRSALNLHDLVLERLLRQGIDNPEAAQRFLNPDAYTPASPYEIPGLTRAVERIRRAISQGERILIWGDFDVDGQTATALLYSALSDLGAQVQYHVPNRFSEGHGIHLPSLQTLLDDSFSVLLTCDTGIAAHASIDYAQSRGVDVVVTDHHALPPELPQAYALVNVRMLPEGHPLLELPGVGVAYKLIEALYAPEPATQYLDLVAMGIVADVMVQVDDVRYLLQRGLDVLRSGERPGLHAMMRAANLNPAEINEGHIGFTLAPRLNAIGRLDDANPAVELLTTRDPETIAVLVNRMESLNAQRRFLSGQVYEAALAQIEREPALLDYAVLVLEQADWHTGVIGIVASRLVDQFGLPCVLLSGTEEAIARGSARSVPGCDITAALRLHEDLLLSFGGHNMAAGMSLKTENIENLRRGLSRTVRAMLRDKPTHTDLDIDAYLDLSDISLDLCAQIEQLAPFGMGNPPLMLATRSLHIKRQSTLGRKGEHLQLTLEDEAGQTQRVIWWQGADQPLPPGRFNLAYTLRRSDYKGRSEALVEWIDAQPLPDSIRTAAVEKARWTLIDLRDRPNPDAQVLRTEYPDALLWREAQSKIDGADRYHLQAADDLIVWTTPPDPDTWELALAQVQPRRLILVGQSPQLDDFSAFTTRLAGLVKYALNARAGRASMQELAAAMAHQERSVRAGLQWLSEQGQILAEETDGNWQFSSQQAAVQAPSDKTSQALRLLLDEAAAYRAHWRVRRFDV